MVTGRGDIASIAALYARYCSSSSGKRLRFKNKNSERKRPMPCAPAAIASLASAGVSILACNSMACPSRLTQGTWTRRSKRWRSSTSCACKLRYSLSIASSGATTTTPRWPSRITKSSSRINSLARPAPTSAGTFIPRARIAVCEVTPP